MRNSKWSILAFTVANNMFSFALPSMALSVLSKQISEDLGMSVVQVGILWGSASVFAVVSSLFGGMIVDRVGPRMMLTILGVATGCLGLVRATAWSFESIVILTALIGAMSPLLTLSNFKVFHQHFPREEIVLANGIMSAGMALGFLLGAQLSATFLAPLLGGWRAVFGLYSIFGLLFSVGWWFVLPPFIQRAGSRVAPLMEGFSVVVKNKRIWLLGGGILGVNGAITGVMGYLPLYLQNIGWPIAKASASLTVFHFTSLIFTLPIVFYSARFMQRRFATMFAGILVLAGFGLLFVAQGWIVWLAVILAGLPRDGFMALFFTQVSETEGVGASTLATATGITMMFNGLGSIIAPPTGNMFEAISPAAPFAYWAILALLGVVCLAVLAFSNRVRLAVNTAS